MSGITGWYDPDRSIDTERPVIQAMTATQSCRGPDADEVFTDGHIGLGHRRLAVRDPANGIQPMALSRRDGTAATISYSGEIYNVAALRSELSAAGHRFRNRSDTEVVLHAYDEWGTDLVHRLVGMYAFALWDSATETLLLVRDRLGVKPLHYARVGNGLVFGSEPKSLLAHPAITPRLDGEGLVALFALFGVHRPGRTPYADIDELAPGHFLLARGRSVTITPYWQLAPREHTDDPATTVARVRELLRDAVDGQLVSDVPLCALVSGGIDSSAIAALAQESLRGQDHRLSTFAVEPAGHAEDFRADRDRPEADAGYVWELVRRLRTDHQDAVLGLQDIDELQHDVTSARDLPSIGDLDASLLGLFREVRAAGYPVALSGESADETFGGYAWFHDQQSLSRDGYPWMRDNLGMGNLLRPDLIDRLDPIGQVRDNYAAALRSVPESGDRAGDSDLERQRRVASHLAITRFLPVLLDRTERTSMATSVEARLPFCDHRLVEYVWNVPWLLRHPDGQPKGLLRQAVSDLLPDRLVHRPKAMFPTVASADYDHRVRSAARTVLQSTRLGPLLDPDRVQGLIDGNSPRPPWLQRMALAYLVQVDFWMQRYDVLVEL